MILIIIKTSFWKYLNNAVVYFHLSEISPVLKFNSFSPLFVVVFFFFCMISWHLRSLFFRIYLYPFHKNYLIYLLSRIYIYISCFFSLYPVLIIFELSFSIYKISTYLIFWKYLSQMAPNQKSWGRHNVKTIEICRLVFIITCWTIHFPLMLQFCIDAGPIQGFFNWILESSYKWSRLHNNTNLKTFTLRNFPHKISH